MSLFNPQPAYPSAEPSHKKTIIIAGVAIFGLSLIIALIAGIVIPAKQNSQSAQNSNPTSTGTETSANTTPVPSTAASNPTLAAKATSQPQTTAFPTQTIVLKNGQSDYPIIGEPTVDVAAYTTITRTPPTPTPLPGPFYIPNGKQNDLIIRLFNTEDGDLTYAVQLVNTKTHEVRVIGYQYADAPGDSAFFNKDFSQVIFLGGSQTDYQKISVYSIPLKRLLKLITLEQIKTTLPALQVQKTGTLSEMYVSPDGKRVAMSYGNTFNVTAIDPTTLMFVVNLTTQRMQMLSARGLVKGWKDNTTVLYTPPGSADPNATQETPTTLP